MEGIPEKDMEERRRLLEQKTQGKVGCGCCLSFPAVCLTQLWHSVRVGFNSLSDSSSRHLPATWEGFFLSCSEVAAARAATTIT